MPRRWVSLGSSSPRSIVSPNRLKIRPRVPRPTGTVIGPPVSITSVPRARPSVVSIATARTRSSPRCCWTSHTSTSPPASELMPSAPSSAAAAGRATVVAWLISGRRSGNTASITTPWISSMRPTLREAVPFAAVAGSVVVLGGISSLISSSSVQVRFVVAARDWAVVLAQTLRSRDHLHDLLGDLGLAGTVHLQCVVGDDFAGVLRSAAHRRHLGAEETGRGLHQRSVDRYLDVVRNQAREDLLGVRLVVDRRALYGCDRIPRAARIVLAVLTGNRLLGEREQPLTRDVLCERRDVGVVEHLHAIDTTVDIGFDHVVGNRARVGVGRSIGESCVAAAQLIPAEGDRGDTAAPGRIPAAVQSLAGQLGGETYAGADDLGVEPARQSAIAGDEQQANVALRLVLAQQWQSLGLRAGRLRGLAGHASDRIRVRTQSGNALLCPS